MEAILEIVHTGCYTSRLTLDHPVAIHVLSGHKTRGGSVGLWELSGPDAALAPAFEDLKGHPNIVRADVLRKEPGHWILETVDREAEVSNALIEAGLVFLPPVVIRGGTETYRVFALTRAQVQKAVSALTPKNKVRLVSARERTAPVGGATALSPQQRATLALAFKEGYYDRPRRIDQERLAKKLGISRPALAERLQRAERRAMEGLFG